jgi:glycosyltransferase involved in cell wall biosynthesis
VSPRADASIVVIAFNVESTVTDCVSALLTQRTTLSIDVLVVDDGSTDRTRQLVLQIAERDPRVRLLELGRNRGRGAARSCGLEAVDAAMVGYVDADVIVPLDWLERCASALATHSAVSGIATPDGDCIVLARILHPTTRVRRHTLAISGGNVLFEARVLREVGFEERARLGEDVRLARRMTTLGYSIATVPGLVAEHRETKSYPASVRWMWQNGVDAARLPFELRMVRVPDVAWLGWIVVLIGVTVLAAVGSLSWAVAVGSLVGCTTVVAGAHTVSRFRLRPRTVRWLAAAALDVPLMTSYLAGRTVGFPAAALFARPRTN